MATICSQHLALKVRIYAANAENAVATVHPVEFEPEIKYDKCEYCESPAEFIVSYSFPKKSA